MKFVLPKSLLLPVAAALVFATPAAYAADVSWIDLDEGLFSDGANWSSGAVPGAGDVAIVANGGTALVQAGNLFDVQGLRLRNGGMLQSEGIFNSSGIVRIGDLAGTVAFEQTGGSLTALSELRFADGAGASSILSTVTASIGGSVTANSFLTIGRQGGEAHVTVTGSLSKQTAVGRERFIVGDRAFGIGTVTVKESGSLTSGAGLDIGNGNGSNGSVSVQDNATFSVYGTLAVGGGLDGSTGTGSLALQTSETTILGGEMWVANGAGSNGTVTMDRGELIVGNWVAIGRGGTGTFNMNGGTFTKTGGGNFIMNGSLGTMNHTDGTIDVATGETWLTETPGRTNNWIASGGSANLGTETQIGRDGTATMTIQGSADYTNGTVIFGRYENGNGTLNLNGGTFAVNRIQVGVDGDAPGTGRIQFNGGVLKARQNEASFLHGFAAGNLDVRAGGMILDTDTFDVGISSSLGGVGGLVKQGTGMLTLSGAHTFSGAVSVVAGALALDATGALQNAVTLDVAAGAGLVLQNDISLNDFITLSLANDVDVALEFSGTEQIHALFIGGDRIEDGLYSLASLNDLSPGLVRFSGDPSAMLLVAVPEPSTIAMMVVGLGLAVAIGRRLRRS